MKKNSQHVLQDTTGKWVVKKGGAEKATKRFSTQKEAIIQGRLIARNQKAEFYVHNSDGKIRSKASYGNDPCPPKKKK
jgi:hypothetical protein